MRDSRNPLRGNYMFKKRGQIWKADVWQTMCWKTLYLKDTVWPTLRNDWPVYVCLSVSVLCCCPSSEACCWLLKHLHNCMVIFLLLCVIDRKKNKTKLKLKALSNNWQLGPQWPLFMAMHMVDGRFWNVLHLSHPRNHHGILNVAVMLSLHSPRKS